MTCPRNTPWGRADHVELIAPGPAEAIAAAIDTARHFAPLALARYQSDQEARYACALNSAEQNGLFGGINFRTKYPDAETFTVEQS